MGKNAQSNTKEEVRTEIESAGFEYGKDFSDGDIDSIYRDVAGLADINGARIEPFMIGVVIKRYLPKV
jgi:hypothetical protein